MAATALRRPSWARVSPGDLRRILIVGLEGALVFAGGPVDFPEQHQRLGAAAQRQAPTGQGDGVVEPALLEPHLGRVQHAVRVSRAAGSAPAAAGVPPCGLGRGRCQRPGRAWPGPRPLAAVVASVRVVRAQVASPGVDSGAGWRLRGWQRGRGCCRGRLAPGPAGPARSAATSAGVGPGSAARSTSRARPPTIPPPSPSISTVAARLRPLRAGAAARSSTTEVLDGALASTLELTWRRRSIAASSSLRRISIDTGRRPGSRARQRMTRASTVGGRSERHLRSGRRLLGDLLAPDVLDRLALDGRVAAREHEVDAGRPAA